MPGPATAPHRECIKKPRANRQLGGESGGGNEPFIGEPRSEGS